MGAEVRQKIEKIKRIKKRISVALHRTRKFSIGATLMLCGLFGGGQAAANPKSDEKATSLKNGILSEMYAYASHTAKESLPKFEEVCNEINKISLEEAAWDRTAFVFNAVVDSMNTKASEALQAWKNPREKQALVKNIMYAVTGQKKFAPSCIATCNYSIFKAFDALADTTNIVPEEAAAFGNAFLQDEQVKKYTVTVKPGANALQQAIKENNVQPGDFVLIPRNKTNYHTVMYVGKDEKGNYLYSANNNPAVCKNIDYYNQQARKWNRPSKIVKCNEMYKDQFLNKMLQMETEGIAKEDILMYVYNTMGQGEIVFNNILLGMNRIRQLDDVTPFVYQAPKFEKPKALDIIDIKVSSR